MDRYEIIALGIVLIAALLAVRYFLQQKSKGCCSKNCFKPASPKDRK